MSKRIESSKVVENADLLAKVVKVENDLNDLLATVKPTEEKKIVKASATDVIRLIIRADVKVIDKGNYIVLVGNTFKSLPFLKKAGFDFKKAELYPNVAKLLEGTKLTGAMVGIKGMLKPFELVIPTGKTGEFKPATVIKG